MSIRYPFEDVPNLGYQEGAGGKDKLVCRGCGEEVPCKEFEDITDKVYKHRLCAKPTPGVTPMSKIDPQR